MKLLVTNHPQSVEKSDRRPSQNLAPPAAAAATAAMAVTRESGNIRVAGFATFGDNMGVSGWWNMNG